MHAAAGRRARQHRASAEHHALTSFNATDTQMFQLRGFRELSPEDTASESQLLIGQ